MKEDWLEVTFNDVSKIVSGKNQKMVVDPEGIYPIYGSGGEIGRANDFLCKPGTTIIGRKGTINSPIYMNEKFWNVDTAFGIAPFEFYQSKLLYYFCILFNFHSLDKSTAVPSLAKRDILKIQIPLPPLPEQRAIVAKIETLFSELDNGIANLKTAQEQLKVYRQAVLKKAFEGDWEKTSLGALYDFVGGGTPSKKEQEYWNGDIPWASVKDIKGDYLNKTQDFITELGLEKSSANLALKDEIILITRISPGKAIITNITTAINQDLKVVKPKEKLLKEYIYYTFKAIERECIKLSNGTTVLGINLTNLKEIEVPILNESEQKQIVQEIESRLSVCDEVEKSVTLAIERSRNLRQSILKKAFEGKLLTEVEIAACKKEKDWEPAGELLKRIDHFGSAQ